MGKTLRIVVTGGPGGGKTTAADLFRREMGDRVTLVPEAATLLFSGGFPRAPEEPARRAAQGAIFHVQRNLEEVHAALFPARILLCDRGTVDGAAYWPGPPEDFFASMGTSEAAELARYDAVLFFETAAAAHAGDLKSNNPVRTESAAEALVLDRALHAVWSRHPRFVHVPSNHSFFRKISIGLGALERLVGEVAG